LRFEIAQLKSQIPNLKFQIMKYLDEYRDADLARSLLAEIAKTARGNWVLMEICGGQTHSLVKNGIINLLPKNITMVHGPGCPVCVTPVDKIDMAVDLAARPNILFTSFGDMLRVPGSKGSLLKAKSLGADVRIVYSPLEAVKIAAENPQKEVVFFAVGFETTAPANALAIVQAHALGLKNFSLLASHVLVPPAIEAILSATDNRIQGFLAAGHVCTVMGISEYYPIAEKYQTPIVITGFEPVDLLRGILKLVTLLEAGTPEVANAYARVVRLEGNPEARELLADVFEIIKKDWRGIGEIPASGLGISPKYAAFDAEKKFNLIEGKSTMSNGCMAGDVLRGAKKPVECPHFGKTCTPLNPLGAPMVSSEGACAAYYHYNY
jgi:hydrogenase expression/formation protein HypD